MEFGILGSLQVRAGGTTIDIRPGHPRTLLIALLLRVGETVTSDALTELLWGAAQPQHPSNALQVHVSYLRKALSSAEEGAPQLIETRPGGYSLTVSPDQIDVHRFESLVREAESARVGGTRDALDRALERLDDALALWRGDALSDVDGEPFAVGEITRLEEARWAAIETRNDLLLELGRHRELVGELSRVVDQHALRERFYEQLILALYRCGRQADALLAYERARATLLEELGLEPGPSLRRLEHAVLEQDPSLDRVSPAPAEAALPAPLTALIGREGELDRVDHLLDENRIVTLTGPGGAGKSRLAIEVARRRSATHSVWFVDLGTVSDGHRVAAAVATGIGVPSSPDENTGAAIAQALSRECGLLVLDTCEHVLSSAAEIAVRILRVCPEIRILATSRRPLGITGEIAWPVPPLALPPPDGSGASDIASFAAVALFAERAAAVRPGFEVTDATAADVAAICLGLDGLPLAIELAAARADLLTPAAINARLQNRFEFLVEGGREAAARQQTLRAAIDWSFDLLDDDQRRFFARLGVFGGSFDLDAAMAVAGAGLDDPFALFSALVRSSMVFVSGEDRYRLLDSLRAYAGELLEVMDDGTRETHAWHYTTLAEEAERQIVGREQVPWLARVRADIPNFRTALEWSLASGEAELAARLAGGLSWFWTLDGMLAEAVEYLERVAPLTTASPLVRSKVLSGAALVAASLGRLEHARAAAVESVALGQTTNSTFAHAFALNALAVVEWALGDLDASAAAHDEALALLRGTDNPWVLGVCLALRARTALDRGDPAGKQMAEAALPAARASGDRHVIGLALLQIAQLRLADGNVAAAVDAASECLRLQEEIAYTEGSVAALHVLARSVQAAGDTDRARRLNLRALALADRIGHVAALCEALEALATLASANKDYASALRLIETADLERTAHDMPLHARDRDRLDNLRRTAEKELELAPVARNVPIDESSTADVIASLLPPR
jgi:predicted ATPase/DNA-binding SARP family transcriptional activator